jgi:chromosome segregation ATPase
LHVSSKGDSQPMALAGKKAQRYGWRHQAEWLALNHTAVATAACAAVGQTRRQPATDPASLCPSVSAAKSERHQETSTNQNSDDAKQAEWQMARDAAAAWVLNARRETLAARAEKAKAKDERIAELESKLATALERISFQDNENQSLQMSLDLTVIETLRLSSRLSESNTTAEELSSQLEKYKTKEAERDKLAAEINKKIELLQNLIQVKERRVQKLERARSKLINDSQKLLKTCAKRDQALARAEERIGLLTELFAQLETKADFATSKEKIVERPSRLQRQQMECINANAAGKTAHSIVNLWQRELDCDEWLLGRTRG